MTSCSIILCGARKNNNQSHLTMHRFPKNEVLRQKWLEVIGMENIKPGLKVPRVCSSHFTESSFNKTLDVIRLRDDAVPSIHLVPKSNYEPPDVEACRICLATDVKMHSLQGTYLGTCMESIAELNQNGLESKDLPQYVCYLCEPSLKECYKLIKKWKASQTTLLDIFNKHGKITKNLIKQQIRRQSNMKSTINTTLFHDYIKIEDDDDDSDNNGGNGVHNSGNDVHEAGNDVYDNDVHGDSNSVHDDGNDVHDGNDIHDIKTIPPSPTADSNDSDAIYLLVKDDPNMQDIIDEKFEVEISDNQFNDKLEISTPVDDIIDMDEMDDLDTDMDASSDDNKLDIKVCQGQLIIDKRNKETKSGLTPTEKRMQKHFKIVKLPTIEEQIAEWQKGTVRPFTSVITHQCEICHKTFAKAKSYSDHLKYHDPSLGPTECPVCKRRFRSKAAASSHARRIHGKKFLCKKCPKTFTSVLVAIKHHRWHSGHQYKCDMCSFSTLHETSLSVHKRSVHAHAHACALCGRAHSTQRALHVHIFSAHVKNKGKDIKLNYRCEPCNRGFATKKARQVHNLTCKSNQKKKKPELCIQDTPPYLPTDCSMCDVQCASFKELVLHSRAQHPRMYSDPHYKHQHRRPTRAADGTAGYPVDCQLCGETLVSRQKHWFHMIGKHPENKDTYQPIVNVICDTCGKGFQNETKLRIHQIRHIHSGPTVRCPTCPRLFYDKYLLARHVRTTHADAKPYMCGTCGMAFKLSSNLLRHSKTHLDEFPFECTICNKKFKHKPNMRTHIRTVHFKQPHPVRKKRSRPTKKISDSKE